MDELLRNWLRRYFADARQALPLIEEELRSYPLDVAQQFHAEKDLIDEYSALILRDGTCPSEVWLALHPGISPGAEAIIKQIESAVMENRKASRLGRPFGPYRLLYRIGAGGMAEVYAAGRTDVEVKRRALKIIHLAQRYQDWPASQRRELLDDLGERLRREAAILEEINHPRIVRYFDPLIDPTSGELAIVTELIEGFSLERLLEKGGAFVPQEALAVATDICEGLEVVHRKQVIHRDLTPANVLIDREGNVKIIDFGLAKSLIPRAGHRQTGLDRPHWRTRRYASPEQLRGDEATEQSDLYMLGKLLYVLLLYRREWEEQEDWPIRGADDPIWNGLPADVVRFVLRSTAEPAERFTDATAMLAELRRLRGQAAPLQDCLRRVRELRDENDALVNAGIGDRLATQASRSSLSPHGNPPDKPIEPKLSRRKHGRTLVASGFALVLVAAAPLALFLMRGPTAPGRDSGSAEKPPTQPIAFKGECFWRLKSRPGVPVPARGLPLGAPDAAYLKSGDRVAFQSELTQGPEAYFYVLHIDATGEAKPFYPREWTWEGLASGEKKRTSLRLPEGGGDAPLEDKGTGLESLIWLVRLQRLTQADNAALRKIFTPPEFHWEQSKEAQQMAEDDEIERPIWLENGIFREKRGGILLERAAVAADPVQQTEKAMLAIRDRHLASYTHAVCYAFVGAKKVRKD